MIAKPDDEVRAWLARTLDQARWFAGKGRGGRLRSVRPLRAWTADVHSWLVEVQYPDATRERYQVLVEHAADGPREPSPEAWQQLWQAIVGRMRSGPGLPDGVAGWADLPVRLVAGEQSHTSFLIGDVAIGKLLRRLDSGVGIETSLQFLLTGAPVPRRYLTLNAEDSGGLPGPVELLTISQQIPRARDGWQLAIEAAAAGADFTEHAEALGRALRRVHTALDIAASSQTRSGAAITAAMIRRLEAAVGEASELAPHVDACRAVFSALPSGPIPVQLVHGDFHLGQTLLAADGLWWIIDFDGEPLKTPSQRRAPDCPQRDVAGMLRSFGYAGAVGSASGEAAESRSAWSTACREAFVSGYRSGHPSPTASERAVLRAYEIDKAVYDVVYETRNRPTWLPLALRSLADALED